MKIFVQQLASFAGSKSGDTQRPQGIPMQVKDPKNADPPQTGV